MGSFLDGNTKKLARLSLRRTYSSEFELNYDDLRGNNFMVRRNMASNFGLSLVSFIKRDNETVMPAGDGKLIVMQRTNRRIRR